MGLDIRLPLGLMFLITGGLMFVYGLISRGSDIYAKSNGENINLQWGVVLFVFGALMYYLGTRKRNLLPKSTSATSQPLRRSGMGH